jgi:hypothetical protein
MALRDWKVVPEIPLSVDGVLALRSTTGKRDIGQTNRLEIHRGPLVFGTLLHFCYIQPSESPN